jgi:hypothetical protein
MMLEHFWLADELGLESRRSFNDLRNRQVGAKSPELPSNLPSAIGALLSQGDHPEYRQRAIASYFGLMDTHLREMNRVLRPGARYVLVVGNSATRVGTLPIHEALVQLARSHGFGLEHAFGYRLRRHYMKFPRAGRGGIILVDWVLTLTKGLNESAQLRDLVDSHIEIDPTSVAH